MNKIVSGLQDALAGRVRVSRPVEILTASTTDGETVLLEAHDASGQVTVRADDLRTIVARLDDPTDRLKLYPERVFRLVP